MEVLAEYHRLTSVMISELTGYSQVKRCREALKALADASPPFVKRVAFHPLHAKVGRAQYIYSLAKRGVEELSSSISDHGSPCKQPRISGYQLAHILAINEFRLHMRYACHQRADITCVGILTEYHGSAGVITVPRRLIEEQVSPEYAKPVLFVPDIVFVLERSEKRALFFVEVDLGTESIKLLTEKVLAYDQYFCSEGFKRYSELYKYRFQGFRLLFVGSMRRLKRLFESLKKADACLEYVWATDKNLLGHNTFWDPLWMVCQRDLTARFPLIG